MEKRGKAKRSKVRRIRKPIKVTIHPDNHEYLKKLDINASRLLDKAIFELRKVTHYGLVLISQKDEGKWARPDSNGRTSPCEGDVITAPVPGLDAGKGFDEISRTSRDAVSLTGFYLEHREGFIASMEQEKLSEGTILAYTRALESLQPIYAPIEISAYAETYGEVLSEKVGKAVAKFATYLRIRHGIDDLLGFPSRVWDEQFAAVEALKRIHREDDPSRVKDLTTKEIISGYQHLPEGARPFYAFLVYTGMRAGQAYDALKKWNDKRVEELTANVDGEIVKFYRYPTSEISRGKKYSFCAYFPAQVRDMIREYRIPYALDSITRIIRGVPAAPDRPINASNIRKFAANMLRRGKAVEWDVAEYIQGRKPQGVGQARYLALQDLADEQYPIALKRNMPDLAAVPELPPAPKKTKPKKKAKAKRKKKAKPPIKTTGRDLQKIWLDHEESFSEWCLKNKRGVLIRPGGTTYLEFPVKINGFFRRCGKPIKRPTDIEVAARKEITALRLFFEYLADSEPEPLGYSTEQWRDAVSYSGKPP